MVQGRKRHCDSFGFTEDSEFLRRNDPSQWGSIIEGVFREPVFQQGQVQNKPFIPATIIKNPSGQVHGGKMLFIMAIQKDTIPRNKSKVYKIFIKLY